MYALYVNDWEFSKILLLVLSSSSLFFVYLEYRPLTTMRVKKRAPEVPAIMAVPPAHNPPSEDSVRNCIVLLFALVGAVYLCTNRIK